MRLLVIVLVLIIVLLLSPFLKGIEGLDELRIRNTPMNCVYVHSQSGLNYPWLNNINTGLNKIQFMEPPDSGIWRDYSDEVWKAHCKVVDHNPNNLVEAHLKAFVYPNTRFAKLKFIFNNGVQIELDEKAGRYFYKLEEDYFRFQMTN